MATVTISLRYRRIASSCSLDFEAADGRPGPQGGTGSVVVLTRFRWEDSRRELVRWMLGRAILNLALF